MSLCENIWTFLFKRICVCCKFFTSCIELRLSCWFTISDCFFLSKPRDMLTWIGNTCLGRFNKSARADSALLANFFLFEASVLVKNVFMVDLSLMRRENSFELSSTLRERLWNSVLLPCLVSHLIIFSLGAGSPFTSSKLKVLVSQLFGDSASEDSVRFEQQRALVFFSSMINSDEQALELLRLDEDGGVFDFEQQKLWNSMLTLDPDELADDWSSNCIDLVSLGIGEVWMGGTVFSLMNCSNRRSADDVGLSM